MKALLSALLVVCLAFAAAAQSTTPQDTTGRTKKNTQAPAKKTQESSPQINRIAVSDPGMPAEKDTTSSKRNNTSKPAERKKKNKNKAAEVSPK